MWCAAGYDLRLIDHTGNGGRQDDWKQRRMPSFCIVFTILHTHRTLYDSLVVVKSTLSLSGPTPGSSMKLRINGIVFTPSSRYSRIKPLSVQEYMYLEAVEAKPSTNTIACKARMQSCSSETQSDSTWNSELGYVCLKGRMIGSHDL